MNFPETSWAPSGAFLGQEHEAQQAASAAVGHVVQEVLFLQWNGDVKFHHRRNTFFNRKGPP